MKIKCILFTALVMLAAGVFAQVDISEADAVFLEIHKTYTLNADGTMRYDFHQKVKLLTSFAVNRIHGETFVVTNPHFQTLTIDKSVTTMADGKEVPSPENAYNETLPRFAHNAPPYAFFREMVVTHAGLERGAVIDLQYHIDTKAEFFPWLMGEEIFGEQGPVHKMVVTIQIPKEKTLQYHVFNGAIDPDLREGETFTVYEWTMNDITMLRGEPNHPAFAEFAPRLIFSTCQDWKDLTAYLLHRLHEKNILLTSSGKILLDPVKALDIKTRILEMQKQVISNIGDVPIDYNLTGFRPQSGEETFQSNTGTNLDKAILLQSLLTSEGIQSDIALVSRYRQFSPNVPSLQQFDGCCVLAENSGDVLMLLPDREQNHTGQVELAGRVLYDLLEDKPVLMQVKDLTSQTNAVQFKADLKMDAHYNLSGQVWIETGGIFYPAYNLSEANDQKQLIQGIVREILGKSRIEKVRILSLDSESAVFSAEIKSEGLFEKIGETDLMAFPGFGSVYDRWHISSSLVKRWTPIEFPSPISEHVEIAVSLPKEIAMRSHARAADLSNEAGHLMVKMQEDEGMLNYERQIVIKNKTIQPDLYPAFRNIIVQFESKESRDFVLETIKK